MTQDPPKSPTPGRSATIGPAGQTGPAPNVPAGETQADTRGESAGLLSRRLVVTGSAVALASAAAGVALHHHEESHVNRAHSFVTATISELELAGKKWNPVGLNLPWSLGWGGARTPSRSQHQELFASMPQESIFRMWAFGNWTPDDVVQLIDLGRPYGHRFILVLSDSHGVSSGERWVKTAGSEKKFTAGAWRNGWQQNVLEPMARAFANDTAVAMWEFMNEPSPDNPSLAEFMTGASSVLRGLDSRHLICSGTGASYGATKRMELIDRVSAIEVTSVHDYDETQRQSHWLANDSALSVKANKPMIVGEFGVRTRTAGSRQKRADMIRSKLQAMRNTPAVSACLYWSGAAPGSYTADDYEIDIISGPEIEVLRSFTASS